jgi:hypothetical protein
MVKKLLCTLLLLPAVIGIYARQPSSIVQQEEAPKCFHELLACISSLLESENIDYYIDKDVLRGQARNGKFIPWSGQLGQFLIIITE